MISWDSGLKCEEARAYYYDCVDGQCADEMPQSIQVHIGQCEHCREEIRRLGEALRNASTSSSAEASHTSMVNALLEMHFQYAEMPVTCALAKRFLPSMAALRTRITIPTPITVHIEQCSKCRKDWLELQSLNLSVVQLQRLTECIEDRDVRAAASPRHEHLSNEQVLTFARVDYAELDIPCLEHVCECVSCRKRALTVRQTVASHVLVEPRACQDVSWEDLFDFALPVGFNPLADEYAQFRKATADHIGHCETCLRRLAKLDQILVNFLPPHECGVVTHFQVVLDETQASAEAGYEDYPIRVNVQYSTTPGNPEVSDKVDPVSAQRAVHSSRGWMKVAAMVAVLLGATVFSLLPRVGAGFLDPVYDATTSVPVVHITVFSDDDSRGANETWIFPPDGAVIVEGQTTTVYNASAGWTRETDVAGKVTPTVLERDTKASLQRRVRSLFGLWPPDMSESATLSSQAYDGFDVYESPWVVGGRAGVWRARVDQETQRVVRVERVDGGQTRTFEVDYPTLSDARVHLRQQGVDLTGL